MQYRTYSPNLLLAPYVRCYWMLRADSNPFSTAERLIPDGAVELIFNFGDGYRRTNGSGQSTLVSGSHLVGPRVTYYLIEQLGAIKHVAIRFAPGGLRRLFGLPMPEVTNEVYSIEQMWGYELRVLEEQLYHATSDQACCAILDRFLLRRLDRDTGDAALFQAAQRLLHHHPSGLPVQQLVSELHTSPRTLERTYLTWTGYTPKQYSQISRFLSLLSLVHRISAGDDRSLSWTALAHEFGYYDHAHMNKDFQRYIGLSPSEYVAHAHWIATQVAAHSPTEKNWAEAIS